MAEQVPPGGADSAERHLRRRDSRPKTPAPTGPCRVERRARKTMSEQAWAYIIGGAGEGATMRQPGRARSAAIVPRVLRDSVRPLHRDRVTRRHPCPCRCFSRSAPGPVRRRADVLIGQAAARLGVPYIFSNQGSAPMEDVAAEMDRIRPAHPLVPAVLVRRRRPRRQFLMRAKKMGASATP